MAHRKSHGMNVVVNNQSAIFFTVMLCSQQNICSEEFPVSLCHRPLVQFSYLPHRPEIDQFIGENLHPHWQWRVKTVLHLAIAVCVVHAPTGADLTPIYGRIKQADGYYYLLTDTVTKSTRTSFVVRRAFAPLEIFVNMDQTSTVPIGRSGAAAEAILPSIYLTSCRMTCISLQSDRSFHEYGSKLVNYAWTLSIRWPLPLSIATLKCC